MSFGHLAAFFGASVLLAVAPGPDNFFVLSQSIIQGARAGLVITLGLCSGLLVHTLAVVLGVATLFQTSPKAFTVLKFLGGAYLLYLGWASFRSARKSTSISSEREPIPLRSLYFRGVIMNVTNPKVLLFFLAFLPQFVDASLGQVGVQLAVWGLVFIVATILVFSIVALAAGWIGTRLTRSENALKTMSYMTALIFVGLAARLILG